MKRCVKVRLPISTPGKLVAKVRRRSTVGRVMASVMAKIPDGEVRGKQCDATYGTDVRVVCLCGRSSVIAACKREASKDKSLYVLTND